MDEGVRDRQPRTVTRRQVDEKDNLAHNAFELAQLEREGKIVAKDAHRAIAAKGAKNSAAQPSTESTESK